MAKLRDFECSICMLLMIEPVTLPCKHELCYKCFTSLFTSSSQCPFCRARFVVWARKEMRMNRVINKKKWFLIQRLFPRQVKSIMEGTGSVSDDDEEPEATFISEAGSLGKEFLEEAQKVQAKQSRAEQEEEAASLALIQRLREIEINTIDTKRLKQIREEEAASLQLIKTIQEEERSVLHRQHLQELQDADYARKVAAGLIETSPDVVTNKGADVNLEIKSKLPSSQAPLPTHRVSKLTASVATNSLAASNTTTARAGTEAKSRQIPLFLDDWTQVTDVRDFAHRSDAKLKLAAATVSKPGDAASSTDDDVIFLEGFFGTMKKCSGFFPLPSTRDTHCYTNCTSGTGCSRNIVPSSLHSHNTSIIATSGISSAINSAPEVNAPATVESDVARALSSSSPAGNSQVSASAGEYWFLSDIVTPPTSRTKKRQLRAGASAGKSGLPSDSVAAPASGTRKRRSKNTGMSHQADSKDQWLLPPPNKGV